MNFKKILLHPLPLVVCSVLMLATCIGSVALYIVFSNKQGTQDYHAPSNQPTKVDNSIDFNGSPNEDNIFVEQPLIIPNGVPLSSKLKAWKTIKIGGKSAEFYRKAFKDAGIDLDGESRIFDERNFAGSEQEVDLVKIPTRELGFADSVHWDEVYAKVEKFGLTICPPEVGFQLRLQCRDQPRLRIQSGYFQNFDESKLQIGGPIFSRNSDIRYVLTLMHDDNGLRIRSEFPHHELYGTLGGGCLILVLPRK